MTDVFSLLSFPPSDAFSRYHNAEQAEEEFRSSAPRKIARLDTDHDSASASRSRTYGEDGTSTSNVNDKNIPILITIQGTAIQPNPTHIYDPEFALVKRSIRVLLSFGSNEPLPASYQKVHTSCRASVVLGQKGEGLYEALKLELERCLSDISRVLRGNDKSGIAWLAVFIEACSWFEKQIGLMESLLAFLDRVYMHGLTDATNIHSLSYGQFAERIFGDAVIAQRLQAGITEWIDWERQNRAVHQLRPVIPKLISRLQKHGQYIDIFETFYLKSTLSFYTAESEECEKTLTAKEFLKRCEERRSEEAARAKDVLPQSSWGAIKEVTDKALLSGRLEWLVLNALGKLMDARQETKLASMYALFATVDGTKILLEGFKAYVQEKVRSIVTDVANDEKMVDRLLDFKAFTNRLVADAFAEIMPTPLSPSVSNPNAMDIDQLTPSKVPSQEFQYALSDSFRLAFKSRHNKPAEMIAKYIDRAMRKGQQNKKDEEFQKELDDVLALYRFTDDKDVFRTFYHRALAKRLLLEKSASDDFEKAMLKKLKELYDPEFSMGDHMFNDLALSRDTMREYLTHRERLGDDPEQQKLNAMVLQRSFWPFPARLQNIDLPPTMQDELNKYTTFYKSKHQGHKLDWDHALGTATLQARFKNGEKELSVSLYQALILLLFNEEESISFIDIKEQTRIDDAELRRTLQSLACGKKRVLRKHPLGKDVHDGDVFHFNADFVDPAYRVHINSIQVKETAEESKKTQTLIESDRKHVLDAAIVRIMKAKKELHNEQLKTLVVDAVKNHFVPDVMMIKQRISELVEQEYLRRSDEDMNVYIYVA
ncbi:Cullin family-domain-containing protein [Abortiporus biennis]|nr:Cullin family-domain-containing protein [Abortiporus biennis]